MNESRLTRGRRLQVNKTLDAFVDAEGSAEDKALLLCEVMHKIHSGANREPWSTPLDDTTRQRVEMVERQLFFAGGRDLAVVLRGIDEILECFEQVWVPANSKVIRIIETVRRGIEVFFHQRRAT